jgi:hypothetical protein
MVAKYVYSKKLITAEMQKIFIINIKENLYFA